MIERCRQLNLRLAVTEDQARLEFTVLLTVQTMNYLHRAGTVWLCRKDRP